MSDVTKLGGETRDGPGAPRRGGHAARRRALAILSAATDLLLARGPGAVSMDTVAERAGVSKATIYRWWPTKETLALDALDHEWTVGPAARRRDRDAARRPARPCCSPGLSWSRDRPVRTDHRRPRHRGPHRPRDSPSGTSRIFVEPRREPARIGSGRAIDRGEIAPDTTVEVASTCCTARCTTACLHGHAALDERVAADVVDIVIAGLGAQPLQPAQPLASQPSAPSQPGPQAARPLRAPGSG